MAEFVYKTKIVHGNRQSTIRKQIGLVNEISCERSNYVPMQVIYHVQLYDYPKSTVIHSFRLKIMEVNTRFQLCRCLIDREWINLQGNITCSSVWLKHAFDLCICRPDNSAPVNWWIALDVEISHNRQIESFPLVSKNFPFFVNFTEQTS